MNNSQFRKLLETPVRKENGSPSAAASSTTSSVFGGKKSSFMPMTPRNVKGGVGLDFARQVRERNAALKPTKKFRSSAPKGVKYGAGYTDRSKARDEGAGDGDDKAERIKALEEQMKLGQISSETFEALRDTITGGDISHTHLVKGLDRQLLERVRRGENVLGTNSGEEAAQSQPDVDEELDKLAEKEVEAVQRENTTKKGSMAPPPPVAGVKRSRDEIIAEFKAQRQQAAMAQAKKEPMLDSRWKKVGEKEKNRIEIDHKGREVLITVDVDGVVKRKVRTTPVVQQEGAKSTAMLDLPEVSRPVLGADAVIPEQQVSGKTELEEEDDDIFEGAGTTYDPLGIGNDSDDDNDDDEDDDGDSDDNDNDEHSEIDHRVMSKTPETSAEVPSQNDDVPKDDEAASESDDTQAAAGPKGNAAPRRNYFNETSAPSEEEAAGSRFAGIEGVLRKAAKIELHTASETDDKDDERAREARRKKHAQMLAERDRDMDDMDMGFGSSRFEDEEDGAGEGKKVRLSEWNGGNEDGDERRAGKKRNQKKPKK